MWVFEELVNGQKLTDIINNQHENVKYLPGIKLPTSIRAVPDLNEAVDGASVLVFVVPHQFVKSTCEKLQGRVDTRRAKAISLIKGVDVKLGESGNGFTLISDIIKNTLGIDCSVLMGANIASEVAKEQFCETTIGCTNLANGELMRQIFHTPYFRVSVVQDVPSVELCGALKNVVGIAAGLVDGLKLGDNTKAAIIRIGLMEMRKFCHMFYGATTRDETFFESCGVADLITTCYGGRNRKIAEAHVVTRKTFIELEKELLNGQKLQGTLTAQEIHEVLRAKGKEDEFMLFKRVYQIVWEGKEPTAIIDL